MTDPGRSTGLATTPSTAPAPAELTPLSASSRPSIPRLVMPLKAILRSAHVALHLAVAAIITLLAWPILTRPAAIGLDPSWLTALHLSVWDHLRQGVDFVFTYGPLGFLAAPEPYLGGTSLLALLTSGAIYLGLITILLIEARRLVPLWAAALIVFLIARMFTSLPPFEAFQALIFVVAVEALAGRIRLPAPVFCTALGVAAAIALLGKLNVGIVVAAMGCATAATVDRRWWRGLALYAGAMIVTLLTLWIALGQGIGDLPAFGSAASELVAGYSDAMGTDRDPGLLWIYLVFAGVVALIGWIALTMSRDWSSRRRIGLAIVCLILGFAMWKTAFVRGAPAFVFATFAVGVAVLGAPLRDRRLWLTSLLVVGVAFAATARVLPGSYLDVARSARSLLTETVTAVIPGRAQRAEARNRATMRERYGLDPTTLSELAGRRVSIDPVESGVASAYPELRWAPLPVFQSYLAYTPALDRLAADRLRSTDGPERILRGVTMIADPPDWLTRQRGQATRPGESIPLVVDGRFRWFEAPAAMLETFCRYRQLSATPRWQVLARTAGSCGPAEPLSTVRAREGDVVPVPVETRPDRFVTVRVHGLEPSIADRVRTALFKAEEWYVTIDRVRYRLVASTSGDGLLLAVPPVTDGTGAFAFGPPIKSLSIQSGLGRAGDRSLTYEFESVPLLSP